MGNIKFNFQTSLHYKIGFFLPVLSPFVCHSEITLGGCGCD